MNTGGMGAVSPVPFADEAFLQQVETSIVQPTLNGMAAEDMPFVGFLFIGLMVVAGTPYVLNTTSRMGDPETEVVMPRLQSDLVDLCEAAALGRLADQSISVDPRTCVTVMLVSGGYPGSYEKGKLMSGFELLEGVIPFHAGTRAAGNQILTNGGRVLALSAFGADIEAARKVALEAARTMQFDGKTFRRDIGLDLQ